MSARDESDRVRIAKGPLALEKCLERDVEEELARVRADPARLCHPTLIVVPSQSLRLHIGRRIAAWSGGACPGLRVVTLFGLARELCAASDEPVPRGTRWFEPLVDEALRHVDASRRRGEGEPTLAEFEGAAAIVAATVSDLIDAGFEPEKTTELLASLDRGARAGAVTQREVARAHTLVRIAERVAKRCRELGVGRPSHVVRCATAAHARDASVLRARAVWIHGFIDATGANAELLEQLASRPACRIYWDACADGAFGRVLRERLRVDSKPPASASSPTCRLARASSIDAEVRSVADHIRGHLDAGDVPESIAVVARDLHPYRVAVRRHFDRLGIPFSAQSVHAPHGAEERVARALATCIGKGGECPIDLWLDARGARTFADRTARPYELRVGMRALGIGTLADLARLDVSSALGGRDAFALPMRGITTIEDGEIGDDEAPDREDAEAEEPDDDDERPRASAAARVMPRREVTRQDLLGEVVLAEATVALLARWSAAVPVGEHQRSVAALITDVLAWDGDSPGRSVLDKALEALRIDAPPAVPIAADEFRSMLQREVEALAHRPLGGAGGGVACLEVVEARACTFERLFVLGLVRGRFPRNVREDPLLSDEVRRMWTDDLRDLPLKSVGRDEERVLFDQVVRAAEHVHLSWVTLDDEGKALLPSVLLERVASPEAIASTALVPDTFAPAPPDRLRPAHEHAVVAAIAGKIDALADVMPLAFRETRTAYGLSADRSDDIAAARIAILREHEPAPGSGRIELGPYFGHVGPLKSASDLRAGHLHVTHLEAIAGCGWKALLTRVLRIEPALDPLAALPDLDARLIGNVVHEVLQTVIDAMDDRATWPATGEVEAILLGKARVKLRDAGIVIEGFDRLVAERARPMLDVARRLDELENALLRGVPRSEVRGEIDGLESALGSRMLQFRADRVDTIESGPRLTDYKTARPLNTGSKPETRLKHLMNAIARGDKLQAMVYARSVPNGGGTGRYVFLGGEFEPEVRVFGVDARDPVASEMFDNAVETLFESLDRGVLFPRLLAPGAHQANRLCLRCEMAQACLRGDSGANRRLAAFVSVAAHGDPAQDAALKLWKLAEAKAPEPEKAPKPKSTRAKKKAGDA